jgi:hypothetical protein
MRAVIKVENNLKEILTFLEEKGYKWSSGDLPREGVNWGSRLIIVSGKTLTHRSITSYDPNAITLEEFKNKIDMKRSNILPGHKLVLENGNVFVVMDYKNTKIVFPEGSSRTVTSLDDLCNKDLSPNPGASRIMKVLNTFNIPIWERKFTRSEIEAGYTMLSKNKVTYLVIEVDGALRIVSTIQYVVGPSLCTIMNEDMTGLVPFEDGTLCREITPPDYVEGPCMFKKDGKYYFMWSSGSWTQGTYRVNTAFADSPFGPFNDYVNVLSTGDSKIANGPGHNGYFYIPEEDLYLCVYHRHHPDNDDGNARFMCLDVMYFGEDGKIKPIEMTTDWEYKDGKVTIIQ